MYTNYQIGGTMLESIKNRRSIRNYTNQEVSKEALQEVLEAIRLSPTWKNKQCFEILVVNNKEIQKQIGELVKNNPCENAYTEATYTLVFLADPTRSGNRDEKPYYMADTAIAIEHAILSATHLGLGTCWVGIFPEEALKELLHIPAHLRIVALSPLGYPNETPDARPRRALEEFIHYNTYEKKGDC